MYNFSLPWKSDVIDASFCSIMSSKPSDMLSNISVNHGVRSAQAGLKLTSISHGLSDWSNMKSKPYNSKLFALFSMPDSWPDLNVFIIIYYIV